ncbi:MAG: DUF4160 domain-containing protein [Longimicrobiaceae bacterium]
MRLVVYASPALEIQERPRLRSVPLIGQVIPALQENPSLMPVISRFYGIVVFINYRDHNPPHFHARYQDQEVIVDIQNGVVTGTMSRRALQMLFEWLELHRWS